MARHRIQFISLTVVLAVAGACFEVSAADEHVTGADVERVLKKGREQVLKILELYRRPVGYTALSVMSVINAGTPSDDAVVSSSIDYIIKNAEMINEGYGGPYEAGLVNILLGMLKDQKYKRVAEKMVRKLERCQMRDGGWGDNSRTQFALLGLKAAEDLGVEVPQAMFTNARKYVEGGQNRDGSWGYQPSNAVFHGAVSAGYGSMTAAGIGSMFIIHEHNMKNATVCGAAMDDPFVRRGLDWLAAHFSVLQNPLQQGAHHYYYLYALERIGVMAGQKFIGGHDWYREGADYLVGAQRDTGIWDAEPPVSTEFALLFLGKGRAPVVMQKLNYGEDWNPDPYDATALVEQASRDLATPMTTQVVDLSATAEDFAAAPILYLQGRRRFEFSPKTRESIRQFVDQGGFIFATSCCGGFAGFDQSFRKEMKEIFPDGAFDKLPETHEIYSVRHKIAHPDAFPIEGLNTGCRTSIFYSPHDICCAWGGCKGCLDKNALTGPDAKNLGVNLIAYAIGFNALKNKLDDISIAKGVKKDVKVDRGALIIGQLFHNGEWNPDPASIPNLAKTLKEHAGIRAEVGKRQVNLGTDELGDFPILYLTGHRAFQFPPSSVDALRTYLDRGGFLMCDACCGRPEFDAAFRRLCADLYPDRPLKLIPTEHTVLSEPYKLDHIQYKPAVKRLFPTLEDKPYLEGISGADGRLQILYSKYNFGCELQGHACASCLGIAGQDAYRVAVNAVMYALSH
jgi:hypothetical protein